MRLKPVTTCSYGFVYVGLLSIGGPQKGKDDAQQQT